MRICQKKIPGLFLVLLIAANASFCYANADQKTVQVVGIGECADCQQNNIKSIHAFKGLKVTIDCKNSKNEMKTRGQGYLDKDGKFQVDFPQELVENENLKEECYAQLHSASGSPCPAHKGIESSKIAFVSKSDGKHTFSPVGKVAFVQGTCTSAFWFKHNLPGLPPFPKKSFPKMYFPPIPFPHKFFPKKKPCPPIFKKPLPPIPKIEKPLPPPYVKPIPPPFVKPIPPPYVKPIPPPVPIIPKPLPPPVPKYTKPLPPSIPKVKKPCPPIYKKPPIPMIKPKPLPPLPKLPPFTKKPCPPFPKLPPFPKFPPHPKFFEHPKFKKWPSLPLFPPHP